MVDVGAVDEEVMYDDAVEDSDNEDGLGEYVTAESVDELYFELDAGDEEEGPDKWSTDFTIHHSTGDFKLNRQYFPFSSPCPYSFPRSSL